MKKLLYLLQTPMIWRELRQSQNSKRYFERTCSVICSPTYRFSYHATSGRAFSTVFDVKRPRQFRTVPISWWAQEGPCMVLLSHWCSWQSWPHSDLMTFYTITVHKTEVSTVNVDLNKNCLLLNKPTLSNVDHSETNLSMTEGTLFLLFPLCQRLQVLC